MSRSNEPEERVQHSVAELIARYGEAAPSTGRRRRRAPEDSNTAPQSIIERVQTDSAPLPAVDRQGRRRSVEPGLDALGPARNGQDGRVRGPSAFDSRDWTDLDGTHANGHTERGGSNWGELDGRRPGPAAFESLTDRSDWGERGGSAHRSGADLHEDAWMGLPPVGAGPEPLNGRTLSGGPITDRLPRLDPIPPAPIPEGPALADPAPWPGGHRPLSGEPAAGLGTSTQALPRQSRDDLLVDDHRQVVPDTGPASDGLRNPHEKQLDQEEADDQVLDLADEADAQPASPVREWVVMVTQIGGGVVGGAVLWLICEWLWQRIPVAALVVALAVITGLVWVVRHVRRAEDLQTTVIAVLVGLFVTVSPAALLLVGR